MATEHSNEKDGHQGHFVTRETIERLRRLREQIWEENNREFFEDSAEIIRKMREERTQYLMELFDGNKTNAETNNHQ